MDLINDREEMIKQKKGLLITILKRKFEDRLYDKLDKADFTDMDGLDKWLDSAFAQYLSECDAIKEYYDRKLADTE